MAACDFNLELFCRVDDVLKNPRKVFVSRTLSQRSRDAGNAARLAWREPRAFYRWVQKELSCLFPRLPEHTRLFRWLVQFEPLYRQFRDGLGRKRSFTGVGGL